MQKKTLGKYKLEYVKSAESFLFKDHDFSNLVAKSVKKITNIMPEKSTTGGTSDARFIKDISSCIELGLVNKTAHQIDENVKIDDITNLKNIYLDILDNYFFN